MKFKLFSLPKTTKTVFLAVIGANSVNVSLANNDVLNVMKKGVMFALVKSYQTWMGIADN